MKCNGYRTAYLPDMDRVFMFPVILPFPVLQTKI